ncbi:MAG: phosphoenolpyruvate--protein phosphotransferase, partial [Clostridia bacterium]|nr:phosphoenolpyruvate--protein phosphotransferase [Clostridia bacterium]
MKELIGKGVSGGIAIGKIYFHKSNFLDIPDYEIDNVENEILRYREGMKQAKIQLKKIYDDACERLTEKESVIFQTHIMILEDSKFVSLVETAIGKKHNAESAVLKASLKLADIFRELDDEYFRARANDIIDAAHILLQILQQKHENTEEINESEPFIVAAADLLPSDTISFKEESLLGFVTNDGSQDSHTSILARTMGVPSVIQIHEPLAGFNGKVAVIDGQLGKVIIEPDKNTMALYHAKRERYRKQKQQLQKQYGLVSETKNKQYVRLSADIGRIEDIDKAKANDAEGIGIFRTEMLFMRRESCPDEAEQFETYKSVIKAFPGNDVVICTANGGSGKGMDYLDIPHEKNPALGFKGIRISLENREFFRTQLRALYKASVYGKLSVLLPMISSLDEIEYVKREIEDIKSELKLQGHKYNENVRLGVMIETPAAALISDEICKMVDFIMIGTNNLIQYTLAMDRENQKLV